MLALVDSVNQDTEKAINTKLERMDKVKVWLRLCAYVCT